MKLSWKRLSRIAARAGGLVALGILLAACSQSDFNLRSVLPPDAKTVEGARDPDALQRRLPDRRGDLHRGRGPDPLLGHPLPATEGRHGAAAPDPRQQQARDRVDGDPDRDRHRPLRRLLADAQRHRRATAEPDHQDRRHRLPVAVAVRVRAAGRRPLGELQPAREHRQVRHRLRCRTAEPRPERPEVAAAPAPRPGRRDGRAPDALAGRDPLLLRAGLPLPARRHARARTR